MGSLPFHLLCVLIYEIGLDRLVVGWRFVSLCFYYAFGQHEAHTRIARGWNRALGSEWGAAVSDPFIPLWERDEVLPIRFSLLDGFS